MVTNIEHIFSKNFYCAIKIFNCATKCPRAPAWPALAVEEGVCVKDGCNFYKKIFKLKLKTSLKSRRAQCYQNYVGN